MEANTTIEYLLPSQAFAAGGSSVQTLQLLPKQYLNAKLAHLFAFVISATLTPTYTTAPTTVGNNNSVLRFDFYDGSFYRFQGGFNDLRMMERMNSGGTRFPDADTDTASATARYFSRVLHVGPPQMKGAPTDFAIPNGLLSNGEIRIGWGNLTDISADTTAATGSLRIVAKMALYNELRIPPAFQFQRQPITAKDTQIAGRALYLDLFMLNSDSYDAISAGDFGNFTLDFGFGQVVPSINAKDLTNCYLDDFNRGDLSGIMGEPAGASDDNGKSVNHASPLAIVATPADLQPVLWVPPDGRLTKCFMAESQARLKWDGTQSTGTALYERILAQESQVVGAAAGKALAGTGLSVKEVKVRTLSKRDYGGPHLLYMPYKVKVG